MNILFETNIPIHGFVIGDPWLLVGPRSGYELFLDNPKIHLFLILFSKYL